MKTKKRGGSMRPGREEGREVGGGEHWWQSLRCNKTLFISDSLVKIFQQFLSIRSQCTDSGFPQVNYPVNLQGTRVALSVKHPTLDLGSGHNPTIHGAEPCIGLCADNGESAWDSLSVPLSLSASPPLKHMYIGVLSLSK